MFDFLPVVLAVFTALSGDPDTGAHNRTRPAIKREPHELLTAIDRPVRAADRNVQQLLARGLARSRTFADLMQQLDQTDVIVYVELSSRMPQTVAGRLLFATTTASGPRYLRVQVSREGSINIQIAAIAHELQHAIEVAHAPEVRDEQSLERLYSRIGTPGAIRRSYDTVAAQLAGRRVLLEVQG